MFGMCNYYIDRIEYKNLPESKYFDVVGWCIPKNLKPYSLKVLVNGNEVEYDIFEYNRQDLFKVFRKKNTSPDLCKSFHLKVNVSEDQIHSFALMAVQDDGKSEVFFRLNQNQIIEIENTTHIEFKIEGLTIDQDKNLAFVNGWAFSSLKDQQVRFLIEDEGDHKIESSVQTTIRSDLLDTKVVSPENKLCGFRISFPFEKRKKYSITFFSGTEKLKKDLGDANKIKNRSLITYVNSVNISNIKKAKRYIKQHGIKKFFGRLRQGSFSNGIEYEEWFLSKRVSKEDLEAQKERKFIYAPKISLIVATFNTKEKYLREMIDTVFNQSYSNWELCIADGSDDSCVEEYIKTNYQDKRVKFIRLDKNYGISGNMNKALELATGDYVGLYDHDDMLELDALYEVVNALQSFRYDLVYTDEDKFDDGSQEYTDPNFKPDFSPDLFRSHNYITHFFVVNKKIIDIVGGMRSEYDGAQDYDFMFRCIEKANGIYHIPRILYHWRMHPLSTAQDPESKLYCYEAGKKAIEEHYKRIGVDAKVELCPKPMWGMYHTVYSTGNHPLVSIIIPNMNHKKVLETCINSLFSVNSYNNFEIIIIENNSTEEEIFEYYDYLKASYSNIKIVTWESEFNYSSINNFGVEYASGDYLLFLNNDTEMISNDALSEMLGCCMRPEVGAVGAKLLYEDDTVQHAGVVIGFGGYAGHVFNGINKDDYGYMVRARINCNYSAVTAACMMVKKDLFLQVGGFDEQFKVACNDIDLCLKIRQQNKLIVYNAFSLWHHYESKSRGYEDNQEKIFRFNDEVEKFQEKWSEILKKGDPYYNKNFNIASAPFTL